MSEWQSELEKRLSELQRTEQFAEQQAAVAAAQSDKAELFLAQTRGAIGEVMRLLPLLKQAVKPEAKPGDPPRME